MTPGAVQLIGKQQLEFSYSQFLVYDDLEFQPGCDWQQGHVDQGFARRDAVVSFGTLLEFGHARLSVYAGAYRRQEDHARVIAVPFRAKSGEVRIEGPDEGPDERIVRLVPGCYRVTAAQMVLQNDEQNMVFEEGIDIFFEWLEEPAQNSEVIVADEALNPPDVLLEHADPIDL